MLSQKDLKRKIYDEKDSLPAKSLFLSEEYGDFLTQMAEGVTECDHNISSTLFCSDGPIAYTDGDKVNINYDSILTKDLDKSQRHLLYCGLNLHECGHVLFTDFGLQKKVLHELSQGRIYPAPIKNNYSESLYKFVETPGNYIYIVDMFHFLDNCIEDGFVDRAVMKEAPGYARCLYYVNQIDKSIDMQTYEEMVSEGAKATSIFLNMTLAYARHGLILFPDNLHDDLTDMFRQIIPHINNAVFEPFPLQRKKAVWTVFCYLFHFFDINSKQQAGNLNQSQGNGQGESKQQPSDQQGQEEAQTGGPNQSQGNGQGESKQQPSGQQGQEETQIGDPNQSQGNEQGESSQQQSEEIKIAENLRKILKEAGESISNTEKTQHINPNAPSIEVLKELSRKMQGGEKEPSPTDLSPSSLDAVLNELEKIAEKVVQSQICNQQEKEIQRQMNCDIKTFLDGVKCHKNIKGIGKRASITASAKKNYDRLHPELDVIVKRLVSEFQKEIKDRQLGDTLTGLYAGKQFCARDSHRYDKRVMSRKIAPEDIPNMGVGMLIDISDSMSNESRLETAIKCAYITYQFCKKLQIPCFIIGHTTSGKDVVLVSVCDEKSLDHKDNQRIFSLSSYSCNRDGYAVWYCIKRLEKISADQKLLMVISDGRPNHNGYGLETGRADCQAAVKNGIKNGITTIAAAIGDPTGVRSVYKDGISEKSSAEFLDLTDLQKLPKAFVKIIKRRLG